MPVVLVHGSPGTSRVFGSVTPALAPSFRVIVPDLPGFGASTHELPDYSFRAHAQYILELLDELRIRKAQLVGFSMGGEVVLSMPLTSLYAENPPTYSREYFFWFRS